MRVDSRASDKKYEEDAVPGILSLVVVIVEVWCVGSGGLALVGTLSPQNVRGLHRGFEVGCGRRGKLG